MDEGLQCFCKNLAILQSFVFYLLPRFEICFIILISIYLEQVFMDNLLEKIKNINKSMDALYQDIITGENERTSLASMLDSTRGTRIFLVCCRFLALCAFVLVILVAFIKSRSLLSLELIRSYAVPFLIPALISDRLLRKYRVAKVRYDLINDRCEKMSVCLRQLKTDRDTLLGGTDIDYREYQPLQRIDPPRHSGNAAFIIALILLCGIWASGVFFPYGYNRISTSEGMSQVVINDGTYGINEAGEVINPQDSYDDTSDDDKKAITLPGVLSESAVNNEKMELKFTWDYNFSQWTQSMEISRRSYEYYKNKRRSMNGMDYRVYVEDTSDDEFISNLADSMCENGAESGYDEFQQLELLVSFVQGLEYIPDTPQEGDMEEYPKYPIETLCDGGGDCEDTAILLASLLRARGYGVALIKLPEHMAVGIKGSVESGAGSYYELNNERYYYIETTAKNRAIGEIPDEYKGLTAEVLVIN